MIGDDFETHVVITHAMSEELRLLWRRSGVTVAQFIERQIDLPSGLTEDLIAGWISLRIQDALPSHWNFVMDAWSSMPNITRKVSKGAPKARTVGRPKGVAGTIRIDVTDEMHAYFLSELKRTGADIMLDIVQADGAPEGLNGRVVQILKLRTAKTVRDDYWEFIMGRLSVMRDFSWAR